MISYIKGKVIARGSEYVITDTGGVGYKVFIAKNRINSFPLGKEVELYCYLHLRKDETLELYGVDSPETLELFATLKSISGVGPKASLAISSLGTREQLRDAIEKGDTSFFAGVYGIGKKKIQKVILELTGKLKTLKQGNEEEDDDAVDALLALGFSRQKAKEVLSRIPPEITNTEQRIKEALKFLGRG